VERSFNRITVDGDTSTNDACILMATSKVAMDPIRTPQDPAYGRVAAAVEAVAIQLAQAIVRDGEGATKFIPITVAAAAIPKNA